MSGGSNPLKRAFGGDGMAWRREQEDVLAHAKQLGYDRAGGSIISPTDNKQDWESWRNGFVNWKNKNVALEKEGKAFWQQGSASGDGGGESTSSPIQVGPSPMQERAASNIYFPMLVPEYSSPQALDYSAYMPSDSPFGGMGGLLYQPGTQQYQEAFPMDMNILRYQPPQLSLPQVTYSNPIQGFSIPVMGEESTDRNGRPTKPTNTAIVPSDSHLPHGSQGGVPDGSDSGIFGEGGQVKGGGQAGLAAEGRGMASDPDSGDVA